MNKINYQKELDKVIAQNQREGKTPRLLLHVCCAPCSSYCLEYLSQYFEITVYYYNPNISIKEEYEHRLNEEKRLVSQMPFKNPVTVIEGAYEPREFFDAVKGLENEPEGGKRCEKHQYKEQNAYRLPKSHAFEYLGDGHEHESGAFVQHAGVPA